MRDRRCERNQQEHPDGRNRHRRDYHRLSRDFKSRSEVEHAARGLKAKAKAGPHHEEPGEAQHPRYVFGRGGHLRDCIVPGACSQLIKSYLLAMEIWLDGAAVQPSKEGGSDAGFYRRVAYPHVANHRVFDRTLSDEQIIPAPDGVVGGQIVFIAYSDWRTGGQIGCSRVEPVCPDARFFDCVGTSLNRKGRIPVAFGLSERIGVWRRVGPFPLIGKLLFVVFSASEPHDSNGGFLLDPGVHLGFAIKRDVGAEGKESRIAQRLFGSEFPRHRDEFAVGRLIDGVGGHLFALPGKLRYVGPALVPPQQRNGGQEQNHSGGNPGVSDRRGAVVRFHLQWFGQRDDQGSSPELSRCSSSEFSDALRSERGTRTLS